MAYKSNLRLEMIINSAVVKANLLRHEYLTLEVMFKSVLEDQEVRNILESCKVNLPTLEKELNNFIMAEDNFSLLSDEDIDELIDFSLRVSKIMKTAMGISPFVAKKNTPLDKSPFEGIKSIDNKLKKINKALGRYVDVRSTSAKWTWVEYQLAQGDYDSGFQALQVYRLGGNFAAWKEVFDAPGSKIPLPMALR